MRTVHYRRERPDAQKSLVGFMVGDVAYAVPISWVREIVNPIPLTELPHAPNSVAGVVDHRGEVVTVVDLRAHFKLQKNVQLLRSKWILIKVRNLSLGLVVDRVTDVFGTSGQKLREPPRVHGDDARGFLGVITHDEKLTFVLDVERFGGLAQPANVEALLPGGRP